VKKKSVLIFVMLIICSILVYAAGNFQRSIYNKYSASASTDSNNSVAKGEVVSGSIYNREEAKPNSIESNSAKNDVTTLTKEASDKDKGTKLESNNAVSGESTSNSKTESKEVTADNKTTSAVAPNNTNGNTVPEDKKVTQNKLETETPNIIITDTMSNRTILAVKAKFDGRLLSDVLSEVLDNALKGNQIKSYAISNIRYMMINGSITQDNKWRGTFGYISDIDGLLEKKPSASSGWIYYRNGEKVPFGIGDQITKTFNDKDTITLKFYKDALNEK
jgi:hypothetical protein